MEILDKRLNDRGKLWRHVFKALTLLDYLLHAGSENVVIYFRDNIYIVKTLKEFQYVDDYGKDQGANVRQKAKDITNLLQDESRLREERRARASMRDRLSDNPTPSQPLDFEDDEGRRRRQLEANKKRAGRDREDKELQKAIEESKRMAREEQDRIRRDATNEDELQRALKLSQEEEERRIRELEKKNETALFDDDFNLLDGPPNQYAQQQQQQQVDMWGNPIYGMQPQYTSINPYLQPQQTSVNPFFQQQMALQAQQEEYERQMQLQMAAQQYQQLMTQQSIPQPIQPQPTAFGSNNPFAFSQQQQPQVQQQQPPRQPQLQMSAPEPSPVPTADLLGDETSSQQQPQYQQQQTKPAANKFAQDPRFKDLDRMLASGDGIDTFGNTGDLRFGHSQARVQAVPGQKTGNPFFNV